ncbi:MAG: DNA-binding protein [Clostridiales bacterium]|nr:DNA-binding protein [Clostridiales bacterium]
MSEMYLSITGVNHYYGMEPFAIGRRFLCVKEPDNPYDDEAIRVVLPLKGVVGYVANSVYSRAKGTLSAGRIYPEVGDRFLVQVAFSTHSTVIAKVVESDSHEIPMDLFTENREEITEYLRI